MVHHASGDIATSTYKSTIMANRPLGLQEHPSIPPGRNGGGRGSIIYIHSICGESESESSIFFLHRGSLPFIDKEGFLLLHITDVGLTKNLSYYGAFLWSLEKHLPDVVPMIFHHDEVVWTSVYKFHDWSMGRGGSLLTTDYKSPQVSVQNTS